MLARELEIAAPTAPAVDLVFRTPANWTYVFFFFCLGSLHLSIALPAFMHGRWEGYMSLFLGISFISASLVTHRCRFELAILQREKRLRLRSGLRRLNYQRYIPFADVSGVRLTMSAAPDYPISRIELLCDNEDIECPPTSIPRQEALCLAMLLGVRLIKVNAENEPGRRA